MPSASTDPLEIKCDKTTPNVLVVQAGDTFVFNYHRHYSVGVDFHFEIDDPTLVQLTGSTHEYVHPDRLKPGWTGGDREKCQWIFQATLPGVTTLTIQELFRGEIQNTCVFEVIILGES